MKVSSALILAATFLCWSPCSVAAFCTRVKISRSPLVKGTLPTTQPFIGCPSCSVLASCTRRGVMTTGTQLCMSASDESIDDDNNDEDDDNDDDDEVQQPYGNRSLGWTHKYRSVISYEKARRSVMDLGLRSKDDWDEYVEDGKPYHGPYLPNHPDQMFEHEWVSWDEFLGITRSHDETRDMVRMLKLNDMDEYVDFVAADTKRARGLRIPAKPEIVYKNKGWISMEHFFGNE